MMRGIDTMLRRLATQERGATLIEFAIVAPVFLLLLFGVFDVGQGLYVRSTLQGALQDAGRDAGLESGSTQIAAIDAYVKEQVQPVAPDATFEVRRSNYQNFTDVGRPEDFTDSNNNDAYDADECFIDENDNQTWDDDVGKSGLGGANDVMTFTVEVTYDRLFPLWRLIGQSQQTTISGTTVLRNQPFGGQAARPKKNVCPA